MPFNPKANGIMNPLSLTVLVVFLVAGPVVIQQTAVASDNDWPMWRSDSQRSAATTNELPETLEPLWSKKLSRRTQAWDDPLNLDLMTYDRVFEPIVINGRVLVGFNDQNKLVAFDADTGEVRWDGVRRSTGETASCGLGRPSVLLQR